MTGTALDVEHAERELLRVSAAIDLALEYLAIMPVDGRHGLRDVVEDRLKSANVALLGAASGLVHELRALRKTATPCP